MEKFGVMLRSVCGEAKPLGNSYFSPTDINEFSSIAKVDILCRDNKHYFVDCHIDRIKQTLRLKFPHWNKTWDFHTTLDTLYDLYLAPRGCYSSMDGLGPKNCYPGAYTLSTSKKKKKPIQIVKPGFKKRKIENLPKKNTKVYDHEEIGRPYLKRARRSAVLTRDSSKNESGCTSTEHSRSGSDFHFSSCAAHDCIDNDDENRRDVGSHSHSKQTGGSLEDTTACSAQKRFSIALSSAVQEGLHIACDEIWKATMRKVESTINDLNRRNDTLLAARASIQEQKAFAQKMLAMRDKQVDEARLRVRVCEENICQLKRTQKLLVDTASSTVESSNMGIAMTHVQMTLESMKGQLQVEQQSRDDVKNSVSAVALKQRENGKELQRLEMELQHQQMIRSELLHSAVDFVLAELYDPVRNGITEIYTNHQ